MLIDNKLLCRHLPGIQMQLTWALAHEHKSQPAGGPDADFHKTIAVAWPALPRDMAAGGRLRSRPDAQRGATAGSRRR